MGGDLPTTLEGSLRLRIENKLEGGKGRSWETSKEITTVIQVRGERGLGKRGSNKGGKQWPHSRY